MTSSQQGKDISVCSRLKSERESLRLTQQEIADALDMSLKTVTRWEKRIPIPSDKLGGLIKLGFDALYVLTGQRSPVPAAQPAELNSKANALLDNYQHMSKDDQDALSRLADSLAQSVKTNNESA